MTTQMRAIQAVICGSYRKGLDQLKDDYAELRRCGVNILSPRSLDFVSERDAFVYLAEEENVPAATIEAQHLAALQRSDFVWLHDPESYVGPSGALEIGFAHAIGLPIFAKRPPADVTIAGMVEVVSSASVAAERAKRPLISPPARSLSALQAYYGKVAQERAYSDEDARDCMLLLTEEVGELARAVRKTSGIARHGNRDQSNVAEELADIQLYLLHMANIVGINLAEAVEDKERVNAERFISSTSRVSAVG
jgi:NTP pyrophosphatase (non-canonical NTP hydrolase)